MHRYDCGVYACCLVDAVCSWQSEGKRCEEQEPLLAGWLRHAVGWVLFEEFVGFSYEEFVGYCLREL